MSILGNHQNDLSSHDSEKEAWKLLGLGRNSNAADLFGEVVALHPKRASAWFGWGVALGNMNKHREAVERYTIAFFYDPKMWQALYNEAHSRINLGEFETAVHLLDRAEQISGENADFYYLRGLALLRLGAQLDRSVEAKNNYSKAIALDPNMKGAYFERGLLYFKLGELSNAYQDFDAAIRLDPNYLDAKQWLQKVREMKKQQPQRGLAWT